MGVDEQRMAEDRAGLEQAELVRPLHRSQTMALQHLLDLVDALGAMHREGQLAVARGGAGITQQVFGAGVDL